MKVLDLQCSRLHVFEGWFASEDDFRSQQDRGLLVCPMCNDSTVRKILSAPRLNLLSSSASQEGATDPARSTPGLAPNGGSTQSASTELSVDQRKAAQAALLTLTRQLLAQTEDVGSDFAREARRIHHGDAPERGIRGRATVEETRSLMEEGIGVLPLPHLPGGDEPLQ